MTSRWQISAGQISEWLPPLLFAFTVLTSAWVLSDARRRLGLSLSAVAAWTLATLVSPPIVLPLYLVARIFTKKPGAFEVTPEESTPAAETALTALEETNAARDHRTTHSQLADTADEQSDDQVAAPQPPAEIRTTLRRGQYAPPLLYALALLCTGAIYFYRDHQSFDAHLTRAAHARLLSQRPATIREYRAALRLSDDAHTRKLLAIQLAEDGQTEAALAEFRAAEQGGEPDELLAYHIAHTLDALGKPAEARLEYQKFLQGNLCNRPLPDARCEEIRQWIKDK